MKDEYILYLDESEFDFRSEKTFCNSVQCKTGLLEEI